MKDYFKELARLMKADGSAYDGLVVVNKEGIVEYYRPCGQFSFEEIEGFEKAVIGKELLDVYPEITTENSTVMKTLQTGEITFAENQVLTINGYVMKISSTTYPIIDDSTGEIQGAIDAARIDEYRRIDESGDKGRSLSLLDDIVTQNKQMKKLKRTIREVADNSSSVLIKGETGTGKELIAESFHSLGSRSDKPFISQNCAAIPRELLESMFFGTEKGGFTGAESKQGLFELANGGTLFMDEVNSLDISMQAKLLKALESKKIRRIGGKNEIPFDIRLICALNEDPQKLIADGRLREDFYYRISVVNIEVPPLRERMDDMSLLIDHFVSIYNKNMKKNIVGISQMTEDLFNEWNWPGNIRELKNTIESAFNIETSNIITLDSVHELLDKVDAANSISQENVMKSVNDKNTLQQALNYYEIEIITTAMKRNSSLKAVADELGISPQKLNYRIKKLGINSDKTFLIK
jgi:Transcriptional regulator containing PAS, AAA-type ATPase, and DNA-binding domains